MKYNKIFTKEFLTQKIQVEQKTHREICDELSLPNSVISTVSFYCKKFGIEPVGRTQNILNKYLNKKFGMLMLDSNIDKISKEYGHGYKYRMICDCGNYCYKTIESLRKDNVKSCGCLQKKYYSKNGYMDISAVCFRRLRNGAKKRNIKFDIKIEDIWEKYIQQNKKCYITGIDISFNPIGYKIAEQTASVDRIDSNDYYNIENIAIVHKRINLMKHNMSVKELIYWSSMVVENLGLNITEPDFYTVLGHGKKNSRNF